MRAVLLAAPDRNEHDVRAVEEPLDVRRRQIEEAV